MVNPSRLYLTLKLIHPNGALKFSKNDIQFIAFAINSNSKTIKKNITKLIDLKWIRLNSKTGYYHVLSIDKLRLVYDWESRASIEFYFENIHNTKALFGAAIFGYLHKDFWRKVKREKSVRIKGRTYHFLSSSFNYKKHHAPISLSGASSIFDISKTKLSILKKSAHYAGLINVKPDLLEIIEKKFDITLLKSHELNFPQNVVFRNGKYYSQLVDLIIPLFTIRKRKKLET